MGCKPRRSERVDKQGWIMEQEGQLQNCREEKYHFVGTLNDCNITNKKLENKLEERNWGS